MNASLKQAQHPCRPFLISGLAQDLPLAGYYRVRSYYHQGFFSKAFPCAGLQPMIYFHGLMEGKLLYHLSGKFFFRLLLPVTGMNFKVQANLRQKLLPSG